MKACITGATGFIGSRLCQRLRAEGCDVVAIGMVNNDVEQQRRESLEADGIHFEPGNVNDTAFLQRVLQGCDQVFHLAAAQHEANVGEDYFRRINVEGTGNMLEAALACGVKRFVHGSTIGVYGAAMSGELDENSALQPSNHYGRTKLEGEQLALQYRQRLDIAVVRISETYGPGDRRLLKLFKGISKGMFFIAGNGENIHQLIYVDDLIDGLICVANSAQAVGEIYVLAGSERLSTNRMCEDVARAVSSDKKLPRLPYGPMRLLAGLIETVFGALGRQPPINRRSLDFFSKSFFFRQDKVKRELGFSPATPFADGVRKTADWYRQQGLL